jgi:hypothetical protein
VPDWYGLLRAAKYLGVAPWELAERPVYWEQMAHVAENAEAGAREQIEKGEQRRRKMLGRG